jgi:ATP-dependent protease ClpP protease subunit
VSNVAQTPDARHSCAVDLEVHAQHLLRTRELTVEPLAEYCGRERSEVSADLKHGGYLTVREAVA